MGIKKVSLITVLLLAILLTGAYFVFNVGKRSHRILVIQSFSCNHPIYEENDKEIENQFLVNGIHPDIRTIYLDCERYSEKPEIKHMNALIKGATKDGWTPEVILVNNDQATYSLLKSNNPLTKSTPIIFAGVLYPNKKLLKKFNNVTGFTDKIDVVSNLMFIKRLLGVHIAIYTPFDNSFLGKKVHKDVCEQLHNRKVAGNYTTPSLHVEQIKELQEKHGYTIYDHFNIANFTKVKNNDIRLVPQIRVFSRDTYTTDNGERFWPSNLQLNGIAHLIYKCDKFSDLLIISNANPIFTTNNKEFGFNNLVVGGYMTSMKTEAADEVNLAARILKGQKINTIPIKESKKEYAVDWNAIKHLKIDTKLLPESCAIINRPFKEHYPLAWTAAILITVCTIVFLLSLYFYGVRKRHKMNILIKQQHNMLKSSLYAAKAFAWEYQNGYFTIDDNYWNEFGEEPRKIPLEEFKGLLSPEQKKLLEEEMEHLDNKKGGSSIQFQLKMGNSDYSWWESRYFISEKSNNKKDFYGLTFNIDATKQREKELEEMRRLAEKAEMKQSFLENINHEIRTPLNSITGFSHILAADYMLTKEERERYRELVDSNNDKLLQIIDNILLISQLESGEIKMDMQRIHVKDFIHNIFLECTKLSSHQVELIEEDNNCACEVYVDVKYITRAIQHLVENGLKFTNKGFVKIGYKCDAETKSVEIFVQDTGRGIDQDERKLIFNHFYKEDRFDEGLGLGLNITKLIIEKQDGKLTLTSEKNKGSCFSAVLPCIQ